jgi:ABC-2 type transport system ATP-binding protein
VHSVAFTGISGENDVSSVVVRNIVKKFGDATAVKGISFSADRGEIVGLLGPNGAGKTTTIHMMLGLTSHDEGTISILGFHMPRDRYEILQRVNFASAYVSLPGNLTIEEALYVYGRLYNVKNPKQRAKEVLAELEVDLDPKSLIGMLSAGQKTRLNLCKALINRPEVLFLDEPTASLDPDIAIKVRALLKKLRQSYETTVIYTSHYMHEVEELCDRVIFLARGSIVATGTPQEIRDRSQLRNLEEVFVSIARDGELRDSQEVPKE